METINQAPHNNEDMSQTPEQIKQEAAWDIFYKIMKRSSFEIPSNYEVTGKKFPVNNVSSAVAALAQSYRVTASQVHGELIKSYH